MARLKVFAARMGFFDTVIAAPSQKAALEAWGTRQNLFHDGTARLTEEPDAIVAALARPGVLLRRPAESESGFEEHPAPPSIPSLPKRPPGRSATEKKIAAGTRRPVPDRRALDRIEAELGTLDAHFEHERGDLAGKAAALKLRIADLDRTHRRAREALKRALAAARRDYGRDAGR
jgi:hypothetical protein